MSVKFYQGCSYGAYFRAKLPGSTKAVWLFLNTEGDPPNLILVADGEAGGPPRGADKNRPPQTVYGREEIGKDGRSTPACSEAEAGSEAEALAAEIDSLLERSGR